MVRINGNQSIHHPSTSTDRYLFPAGDKTKPSCRVLYVLYRVLHRRCHPKPQFELAMTLNTCLVCNLSMLLSAIYFSDNANRDIRRNFIIVWNLCRFAVFQITTSPAASNPGCCALLHLGSPKLARVTQIGVLLGFSLDVFRSLDRHDVASQCA